MSIINTTDVLNSMQDHIESLDGLLERETDASMYQTLKAERRALARKLEALYAAIGE